MGRNNRGVLLIVYSLTALCAALVLTIHMMLIGCEETTVAGIRQCEQQVEEYRGID